MSTETETETETTDAADAQTDEQPTPIDFEHVIGQRLADDEEKGSHMEWDPKVFHPSQVGYSKYTLLTKKLGLDDVSDLHGTFKVGDLIHEFVQDSMFRQHDHLDYTNFEQEVEFEEDGLVFVGHADIYDPRRDIVYDIKSRSSWYNFDPPVDRHVDQLHCYMRGMDADYGQVIYVQKKDLEVRTWPDGAPFTFSEERWEDIKARATDVRDTLLSEGFPTASDEIPYDQPDSYFAPDPEELDFTHIKP